MRIRYYILLFLFCLSANAVFGQFGVPNTGNGTSNKIEELYVPDTVNIKYYRFHTPDVKYAYQDSTLDEHFHQIDPARNRDFEYLNLGNIGSSAYPIIFQKNSKMGFYIGQNQYDLYNYTVDNVRIYEPSSPFVNARFSPFGDETTFVVKTDFARKFKDGTSISINYDRIKQGGKYTNQNTYITNFASTFSFNIKKYHGRLLLISNVNQENINGGVSDINQVLLSQYQSRSLVDVNLSSALRRNQERTILSQHRYDFSKHMTIGTDLGYSAQYYKYSDINKSGASFYGNYWIDDRGVRQYIKVNTFKASPYLLFKYKSSYLRTGIHYDHIRINDEVKKEYKNQLLAFATGSVKFSKGLALDYDGKIGLGSATGLLDLKGSVEIDLKKNLKLSGGANIFRHQPSYIAERVSLNHQSVYTNNFKNPYGLELFTHLEIPFLNAKIGAKQTTINNAIYYDAQGMPTQYDKTFNVISLMATQRLDLWKIHMENTVAYQITNTNLYGNPKLYTKHNLFFETNMYSKNLLLRIGGEVRLIPQYTMQGFSPVVGAFTYTGQSSSLYPRGDVYITARISKFRAFFKYNNIGKVFNNAVEYNVLNHPQYDNRFRMGVAWMLLN